jgi:hypothetical protein
MRYSPRWNRTVVLSGRDLCGMEIDWRPPVDPWQTYVLILVLDPLLITTRILSGRRKEYPLVGHRLAMHYSSIRRTDVVS